MEENNELSEVITDNEYESSGNTGRDNTIYLSFKNMYIESVRSDLIRKMSSNYYNKWSLAISILLIITPALGLGFAILELTLLAENNNNNTLWVALISLALFIVELMLSGVNAGINFEDIAKSHNKLSNEYKNVHEEIIRIFTPLNNEEINIDLAQKRVEIQNKLREINNNDISIPSSVSNNFHSEKNNNNDYNRLIGTYNSISINNNPLFEPIYNKIVENVVKASNDILLNDAKDDNSELYVLSEGSDLPELQNKFNTLNK